MLNKQISNILYKVARCGRDLHHHRPLDKFERTSLKDLENNCVECFTYDMNTAEYFYTEVYEDDFVDDEGLNFCQGNNDYWITKDGIKPYHWFNRLEHWLDLKHIN